ncbi:structural protein [Vibrio parahaemolyticus]|uniref:structural protein n=1 Tax=Vibrio parahaemolyticus TaxID=670 RepID=UPI0004D4F582|nr:structural protein [Vibrio parahaemolyticus]EGR1699938.1 structural protein [Vibrio parahaemolyticus]MBM5189597.1 structural protein [Vibrio parahaemolyticus]MBM5201924.1 structural protein [Vibrio parahaemolyticus]MBM5206386.1 structural protein [Vibrio parahaemolyticus]MBM5207745.1 structural protein [Vibrio parahaemolyticus]
MQIVILAIIILGIGTFTMTTPTSSVRGIRINNPLNIRIASNPWKGKVSPSRDTDFETFRAPEWGFRAGAILLRNYQLRHELYTLSEIINRFAPPHENHTGNYARFVAGQVSVGIDERIDLVNNQRLLVDVLHAMSIMEVGRHYSKNTVAKGVKLI